MTSIFASIVSGGAIGVADQYLCLLLLSLATRFNMVQLPSEVNFMASEWFIILIGIVWVITVLPAYGSMIDPVFLRFVNTTIGLFSGILVPASGALLSIATANFVGASSGTAYNALQTIAYHSGGAQSSDLWLIGGGGAVCASLFTFVKFLIKPMLATASGMAATTASAAVYKTVENITALIVMAAIYFLASHPWLLILFMAVVSIILLAVLIFALYQLWKLGQGIGKVLRLFETNPKAGFAVMVEPFVWGFGWILMKGWNSGGAKLLLWGVSLFIIWFVLPIMLFFIPPIAATIPFVATFGAIYFIGLNSAKKLLEAIERESKGMRPSPAIASAPAR
ncbi:MAG: hypothetical protein WA821_14040 [Anaerolineales bacterium]